MRRRNNLKNRRSSLVQVALLGLLVLSKRVDHLSWGGLVKGDHLPYRCSPGAQLDGIPQCQFLLR